MLNHKSKEEAAVALVEDKACARLAEEGEDLAEVKKKKKKRKKEKDSDEGIIEPDDKILKVEDTSDVTAELNPEPAIKKKKSKKSKKSEEPSTNEHILLLEEEEVSLKKK